MRFGCGYPMGPLALLDLIGLDTAYEILDTMYKQGRDRLHAPSPIIKQMVSAGLKGRKSGRGFPTPMPHPLVRRSCRTPRLLVANPPRASVCGRSRPSGSSGPARWRRGSPRSSAKAGYAVTLVARSQDKLDAVRNSLLRSQAKQVERGRLTADEADAVIARVTGSTQRASLADADLIVEAIAEHPRDQERPLPRAWTRSASRARSWPRRPHRCRSSSLAAVTSRPGDALL